MNAIMSKLAVPPIPDAKTLRSSIKSALLILSMAAISNAVYAWQYVSAYDKNGVPKGMTDSSANIPTNLTSKILTLLPEGKDISQNPLSKALLTDDLHGNIYFNSCTAKIKVAFLGEGAGYANSLGYFRFSETNMTDTGTKIIFPNVSTPYLKLGDTVDLGSFTFTKGDAIGFTLVANGWQSGSKQVNPSKPATGIFRSIQALNPETTKKEHTVLLSSSDDQLLALGFEDLNRENPAYNDNGYKSDEDFNDTLFVVFVDPFSCIDTGTGHKPPDIGGGGKSKPVGDSGRQNWLEKDDAQ